MRVYVDTSVFSAYYDQRTPERMQATRDFWTELKRHDPLCSVVTLEELGQVSAEMAPQLRALTGDFRIVQIDEKVRALAQAYVEAGVVAARYLADALHIAAAVYGDADILISWNFRHLVRRSTRLLVNFVNTQRGLRTIEILAPPEL